LVVAGGMISICPRLGQPVYCPLIEQQSTGRHQPWKITSLRVSAARGITSHGNNSHLPTPTPSPPTRTRTPAPIPTRLPYLSAPHQCPAFHSTPLGFLLSSTINPVLVALRCDLIWSDRSSGALVIVISCWYQMSSWHSESSSSSVPLT
jgi:hypothetical protein